MSGYAEEQLRKSLDIENVNFLPKPFSVTELAEAARRVVTEALIRSFNDRQLRVWIGGVNMAPNLGPVDERVRIARSVGDAVTALVLGDLLDAADSAELLGLWARLLEPA